MDSIGYHVQLYMAFCDYGYPSLVLQQIYQLCHFLQESPILDGQARSEQTDGPSYTCDNFLSFTNTENTKSQKWEEAGII